MPSKKTISFVIILVSIALVGLLFLGLRQYRDSKHHEKIVSQTENLIFQYAIIREHIIESIMTGRPDRLNSASSEMESLNSNISKIIENAHIPDEYKLTFGNQIDLPGIILLIKEVSSGPIKSDQIRLLNQKTRSLGEKLMLFDRVIINYAQRSIVGLQSMIIGSLALVVFLLTNFLFLGYRRLAVPVMRLTGELSEINNGTKTHLAIGANLHGVKELGVAIQSLISSRAQQISSAEKYLRILQTVQQCLQVIHNATDKSDLLKETCRSILTNLDYCLVWIGIPGKDANDLEPIVADGSTTMNGKECNECISGLLVMAEDQGSDTDQALQAYQRRTAVVRYDILAEVPKGPFKNTPLCDSPVSCASIPLIGREGPLGVMNIYSLNQGVFCEEEVSVLQMLAKSIAQAYSLITINDEYLRIIDEKGNLDGRAQLFRVSRLSALGEIAADVAHEINNLSNGIINYSQVLSDRDYLLENPDAEHELPEKIIKEGEKIAQLTNKITSYSIEGNRPREPVKIDRVLDETLALVQQQFKNDGIKVNKIVQEDLPVLTANEQQLQHVFLNLLNNSRHALNQRFPGNNDAKRLDIKSEIVLKKGKNWLRTTLTDFGSGIDPQDIIRVFDRDFTTKMPGTGSGLGLSISREIIQEQNGKIKIESDVDDHTTVTVDFPISLETAH